MTLDSDKISMSTNSWPETWKINALNDSYWFYIFSPMIDVAHSMILIKYVIIEKTYSNLLNIFYTSEPRMYDFIEIVKLEPIITETALS